MVVRVQLFRSKNCDTVAIFSQKMAARLQENCIRLRSDLKAERLPKERNIPSCTFKTETLFEDNKDSVGFIAKLSWT